MENYFGTFENVFRNGDEAVQDFEKKKERLKVAFVKELLETIGSLMYPDRRCLA